MNKIFITTAIIITAATTQGCEENLNDLYTSILIADNGSDTLVSKPEQFQGAQHLNIETI